MTGKAKFIAGKGIKYMKKIIKGKMYNTETAEYIEHRSSGCYRSDYRYFEEDLYRKRQKNFSCMAKAGQHPDMHSGQAVGIWEEKSLFRYPMRRQKYGQKKIWMQTGIWNFLEKLKSKFR